MRIFMKKIICLNCGNEKESRDYRIKFCSRSCAAIFNNRKRLPMTKEQRNKISDSLKKYYSINESKSKGFDHAKKVGKGTKGKYKKRPIKSIYEVSSRTRSKILSRLNISCCICGWNKDSVDIHHILPKKKGGTDELNNLTPLCPNDHRLADRNKIAPDIFVTLDKILTQDKLNSFYFG